jgi:hypothetical protein
VLTLQTAGEALNWNPHLHGLITDGIFKDEVFSPLTELNLEQLTQSFTEHFLAGLSKLELITDDVTAQILSQQHSGFSVWLGEPFHDTDSKRFVARYVERGPLSLEKLSLGDTVSYTTKDGTTHTFEPLEFLALLSSHIPNTYESITRYYGFYSCRARGERKKQEPQKTLIALLPEPRSAPSRAWAACIKRIYEINPLLCPRCNATMRIVAFVQSPVEIKKIMQSLGLPDFTAPPPMPKPPSDEPYTDFIPNYDA